MRNRFLTPVGANMDSDSRLSLCYVSNANAGGLLNEICLWQMKSTIVDEIAAR
jgi:hypothetical protein